MEGQEKKKPPILSEDVIREAIQSLKEKPLPTDTVRFVGDLPEKMPDRFLKK